MLVSTRVEEFGRDLISKIFFAKLSRMRILSQLKFGTFKSICSRLLRVRANFTPSMGLFPTRMLANFGLVSFVPLVTVGENGRSVGRSVGPSVSPPVHWSVCQSIGLSVGPSVCLSVHRSVCRSIGLTQGRIADLITYYSTTPI